MNTQSLPFFQCLPSKTDRVVYTPLQSHNLSFYQYIAVRAIFYSLFGQTFWPIDSINSVLQSVRHVLLTTLF